MIEDDARDGMDSGQSNFKVIVDQKAEQDYAINDFKGSGMMDVLYKKDPNEELNKKKAVEQKLADIKKKQAQEAASVTAEKGDQLINSGDAEAMYEFSAAVAAEAGQ